MIRPFDLSMFVTGLLMVVYLLLTGCTQHVVEASLPPTTARVPAACEQYRRAIITEGRAVWGTASPTSLFGSQTAQESLCKAEAQSKFAAGLTQFTPGTADNMLDWYKHELNGCSYPFNARCAIRAMVLYDLRLFHSVNWAANRQEQDATMLACYNGGCGWVARERVAAKRQGKSDRHWFNHIEKVCLRAQWACEENRQYPRRILFHWQPAFQRAGW